MTFNSLKQNIIGMKEIIREMYVFTNQLEIIKNLEKDEQTIINKQEKRLLYKIIASLRAQLKILNNSLPNLVKNIGFFEKLSIEKTKKIKKKVIVKEPEKVIQIKYKSSKTKKRISLTVNEKDRKSFLENLSKSNLSVNELKKKYSIGGPTKQFGKTRVFAVISNRIFRKFSNKLLLSGKLQPLNKDLRKMSSPFLVGTYISMIFFAMLISFVISLIILVILLFYKISLIFPFLIPSEDFILLRFVKFFWIVFIIPLITGIIMYIYPKSESKDIGSKIDQELPFVTIHMSAIATSGVQPIKIFKIIIKSEEYKYTKREFKKILNLINFQGYSLVYALKKISKSSPSSKLKALLDGLATTITSGGNIHNFLDKHSETLLFDYKLEREKYTKTSETFMDIYISIVIAAPMILLMLFVIMGSTGMYFMGLTTDIMGILIILAIVGLNIGFLIFLKLKQPIF